MDEEKKERLMQGLARQKTLQEAATYFQTIMDWEGVPQAERPAIVQGAMERGLPPRHEVPLCCKRAVF